MSVHVGFDLRLVPTVVAVADELHFAAAARRLDLAPSAVSHQVSRLESQLGVVLFDRSTRRVEVTEAGAAFVQHARSILRTAHRASVEAAQWAPPLPELTIAVDIDVPDRLIRHLRRFGSPRREISLNVLPMQQGEALHHVRHGEADHCVIWVGTPESDGLTVSELIRVNIWCVVPADSSHASQPSVRLADLQGERLVIYRPDSTTEPFYYEFLDALSGIDPAVDHVDGDDVQFEMCREITNAGGFTITTEGDTAHLPADVVAIPFSPPISTSLALCSPAETDENVRRQILQHFRSTPLRPAP